MSGSPSEIRVAPGAPVEFDDLYERHFDAIYRYVLLRVGNATEAQDLTAQTFYKALRGLWRFRLRGGSVTAWLYRIATNEVKTHFRRRRVVRTHAEAEAAAPAPQADASAEDSLERHQVHVELNRALLQLRPDEQALIVLRYFEDKSYAEIAEILRKRQGALTMRTHRALQKLKAELEKRGIDHEGFRASATRLAEAGCSG